MNKQPFNRLESYIEKLVETVFVRSFGESVNLKSISLQIARSMQLNLLVDNQDKTRQIAPDRYIFSLAPQTRVALLEEYPNLENVLIYIITEIARSLDYQFIQPITVDIEENPALAPGQLTIGTVHDDIHQRSTIQMNPVRELPEHLDSQHPYLAINDNRSITLIKEVINIGRHSENDIQIDDPHVSRHHLQLRKRGNAYILFDAGSKTGTRVNHIKTREHQLQPNDVIEIGHTQMVYLVDGMFDQASQTITLMPFEGLSNQD